MTATCATCPFFKPDKGGKGECHFWPPMPDRVGGYSFPEVSEDEWCAQHPEFAV